MARPPAQPWKPHGTVVGVLDEIHSADFAGLPAATAYRLWQLRVAVFVVEQHCPYLELDGRDLEPSTRHLWAEDDGEAVTGYLRILAEPGGLVRIGRVCVALPARSRGLARRLMQAAHAEVGPRPCLLDAQTNLVPWYAQLGYRAAGPEFIEDGIPHVPMRYDP